jgi:hypothetical protein
MKRFTRPPKFKSDQPSAVSHQQKEGILSFWLTADR